MNALIVDESQLVVGAVIKDLPVRMNLGIGVCVGGKNDDACLFW